MCYRVCSLRNDCCTNDEKWYEWRSCLM